MLAKRATKVQRVRGSSGTPVLGSGLVVRGKVRGEGDLRVEAKVEGDVEVGGKLELAPEALVDGKLSAASVVVGGTLAGDIESSGPVSIGANANVRGNVQASELSIEEGASFVGRVDADFDLPDVLM